MTSAAAPMKLLFDAGRLFDRGEREAPTGVDRVCLAYGEWLLTRPDVDLIPVAAVQDDLRRLPMDRFRQQLQSLRQRWTGLEEPDAVERRLHRILQAGRAPRSLLDKPPDASPGLARERAERGRRALRRILGSTPLTKHLRGAVYMGVGHTSLNRPQFLAGLKRRGVRPVVFIHDLIPITHPEYCRPGEGERHATRIRTALAHADRILVNSGHTRDQLAAFARQERLVSPPVQAVPLGLEPVFLDRGAEAATPPYFLHVGTIEARKNLAFLLSLWRRLEETLGATAPSLVLVGRYGWENEAVLDHLQRSPNLQGLVHQVSTLSDQGLARLVRGATAVLAPSNEEGFDLPAIEALSLGVPVIASDIAAHRELARGAVLIDPLDGPGWIRAVQRALEIRCDSPDFVAPTWNAHFEAVAAFMGLPALKR
jgi:Glycosyltransferase